MNSKPEDKRKHPRRAVLWSGKLQFGKYQFDCQIWNVSLLGAKVKVGLPLKEGSTVELMMDKFGSLKGEVKWQHDGSLGLQFEEPPEKVMLAFGSSVIRLGLSSELESA